MWAENKKEAVGYLTNEQENAFYKENDGVKKVAKLTHFNGKKQVRKLCDEIKHGIGAVLQHNEESGWKSIVYASDF